MRSSLVFSGIDAGETAVVEGTMDGFHSVTCFADGWIVAEFFDVLLVHGGPFHHQGDLEREGIDDDEFGRSFGSDVHYGLVVLIVEEQERENGVFEDGWPVLVVWAEGAELGPGVDGGEFVGPEGEVDDFGLKSGEVMDVAVEISFLLEGGVEDGVAYL